MPGDLPTLIVDASSAPLPGPGRAAVPPGRPRVRQLGDFHLLDRLGTGASGTVYRALQVSKGRLVAVKVLHGGLTRVDLVQARFLREAYILDHLRHQNIVRCYAIGRQHGRLYLAMELVRGTSLRNWLYRLGRLGVADSLRIARDCASALGYAHAHGVIHRDLKPENLLLSNAGELKLADMGVAKWVSQRLSLTRRGSTLGSPAYVAPEQARDAAAATPASDLHSLGCVLYESLTGVRPFDGRGVLEVFLAKEAGRFVPPGQLNPAIPDALGAIISRLLAPRPEDRFQSCAEFLAALDAHWPDPPPLSFLPLHGRQTVLRIASRTDAELEMPDGEN